MSSRFLPRHQMTLDEIGGLEDRLHEYNRIATGKDDGRMLAFVAVNSGGTTIGAAAGYSWARMAEIKQFWVAEGHRGCGLGRGLLEAFVAEAVVRGCQSVWAMSYTFQAPRL